jgi:hypothetical protein
VFSQSKELGLHVKQRKGFPYVVAKKIRVSGSKQGRVAWDSSTKG